MGTRPIHPLVPSQGHGSSSVPSPALTRRSLCTGSPPTHSTKTLSLLPSQPNLLRAPSLPAASWLLHSWISSPRSSRPSLPGFSCTTLWKWSRSSRTSRPSFYLTFQQQHWAQVSLFLHDNVLPGFTGATLTCFSSTSGCPALLSLLTQPLLISGLSLNLRTWLSRFCLQPRPLLSTPTASILPV